MNIRRELPPFRPGVWGTIDKFIGPDATKVEKNIHLYPALALAARVVAFGFANQVGWSISQ